MYVEIVGARSAERSGFVGIFLLKKPGGQIDMEVTELTAETFWKGETEIRGTVMDGEDEYRVRILRKGSQNFDYSCSHISKTGEISAFAEYPAHRDPTGSPCAPHAHALLAEWLRRESRESKHPVSTSQKVRFMVPGVHEPRGEPDHGGLRGGTLPSDPYRYDLKRPGAGPLHGGP